MSPRISKLVELSRLRDALLDELATMPEGQGRRDRTKLYIDYSARIRALKIAADDREFREFCRALMPNKHGELP